jgi:hypothetical protein
MNVGKAALLILASVGTLHLIEVVTSFRAGGWIYYSPVAREYLGERTFIDIFALLGLALCGITALIRKFRRE